MQQTTEELQLRIRELEKEITRLHKAVKEQRYGLHWLDVPEAFETETENKIPILEEVKEKAIVNNDGKPTHILIEGDNYHALTCLNYTHKTKIDLIYIDPPYNTGKDGFTYKDKRYLTEYPDGKIVPSDHPLRHSYWLSFMFKRLDLAKGLLKETGKIVISIDDNELANLVLICSEVFGASNQVAILPTIMNLKGNQDQFGFAGTHEYTVVFAKDISKCSFNEFELDEIEMDKWQEDEIGFFKKGAPLRATGEEDKREDRAEMFYPILIKNNEASTITKDEHSRLYNKVDKTFQDDYLEGLLAQYKEKGFEIVLPLSNKDYGRWRWGFSDKNKKRLETDIIVNRTKNGISLYKKQRPDLNELPSRKPKSLFYKPEYSSGNGTFQIKNILGYRAFKNPKPIDLMKDLITICSNKTAIILDFFAGSGTTLQACLELNNSKFNIQNIICTNNEGSICTNVTYPRSQMVMHGYTNLKGENIDGLGNSLKYYRTSFVGKNNPTRANDTDKVELSQKAGYLLALSENTLNETTTGTYYQVFENDQRITAIYFQEDLTQLEQFIASVAQNGKHTAVYIFSWSNGEEFIPMFDHLSHVAIKTIPQPILEIYRSINK